MSEPELDLTEAVEAAAERMWGDASGGTWDQATAVARFNIREYVTPLIHAASKAIARQAWEVGHAAGAQDMNVGVTYARPNPWRES